MNFSQLYMKFFSIDISEISTPVNLYIYVCINDYINVFD